MFMETAAYTPCLPGLGGITEDGVYNPAHIYPTELGGYLRGLYEEHSKSCFCPEKARHFSELTKIKTSRLVRIFDPTFMWRAIDGLGQHARVAFAAKADCTNTSLQAVGLTGADIEVNSRNNFAKVIENNINPHRIQALLPIDCDQAFVHLLAASGVRKFIISSPSHYRQLMRALKNNEDLENVQILVRLNLEEVLDSNKMSFIGFSVEHAGRIISSLKKLGVGKTGIAYHLGAPSGLKQESHEKVVDYCYDKLDISQIDIVNCGGGRILYELANNGFFKSVIEQFKLKNKEYLIIEPGTALVANSYGLLVNVMESGDSHGEQIVVLDYGVAVGGIDAVAIHPEGTIKPRYVSNRHSNCPYRTKVLMKDWLDSGLAEADMPKIRVGSKIYLGPNQDSLGQFEGFGPIVYQWSLDSELPHQECLSFHVRDLITHIVCGGILTTAS